MSSGASNRQKHREAEAARRAEEQHAPRRIGHLPSERAAEARRIMDAVLLGAIGDPDAAAPEDDSALPEDEEDAT